MRIGSWARFLPLALTFLMYAPSPANPQDRDVLDPEQHAVSLDYQSDLDQPLVDLRARLPWRERFKPGGAFDERFEIAVSQADNAAGAIAEPSTSSDRFDARGVVKAVRVSSGKLKISHGPIERFGMPGMTMLFGVADVSMLDQVGKDDEVEFAVENTEAGFVITEIRRTEGGQ